MLFQQFHHQLSSLKSLLSAINDEQFTLPIKHLGNASIGAHSRHIIELMQCVYNGYNSGIVDYVNRSRNLSIQEFRQLALDALTELEVMSDWDNKLLGLVVDENVEDMTLKVGTTYYREIVYNTEHAIHHFALIKVALVELELNIVDANFGMAYSTIRYKEQVNSLNKA